MKSIKKVLILATGTLLASSAAFAAKSYEKSYVEAYSNRSAATPVPVSVVAPAIVGNYAPARVDVKFVVDANGAVRNVAVPASIDHGLAVALTDAVSSWKFTPAVSDGKPVAKNVVLPFMINAE
jgi:septal ring-binding cell division protein DamX